jgi:hypothetical protein
MCRKFSSDKIGIFNDKLAKNSSNNIYIYIYIYNILNKLN